MKQFLKKIWHFIWHEDDIFTWKGFLSLLINLVLAFIIIKFIFYPALGFVFSTNVPIVAVLSESMEHQQTYTCLGYDKQGGECIKKGYKLCGKIYSYSDWFYVDFDTYWRECGSWYENINIDKQQFKSFNLKDGFYKGDILFIYGAKPENVEIGDIIVFEGKREYPIIHRVVKKYEEDGQIYYQTKGDHNPRSINGLDLNELKVAHDEKTFKGKAILWIPYLGYIKIIPTNIFQYVFRG